MIEIFAKWLFGSSWELGAFMLDVLAIGFIILIIFIAGAFICFLAEKIHDRLSK